MGGRYHFGASLQKIRPFAQAELGTQNMKLDPIFINEGDVTIYDNAELVVRGLYFGVGAGANYFTLPEFSVGLNVSGRMGNFSSVKANGNDYDPQNSVDFRFLHISLVAAYLFY